MNTSLPPSLAGFHLQQHSTDHTQQSNISEADFLARVSAFEKNEEAEKRRAREAMRRMVSDQTKSTRHDRGSGGPKRRDRSPPPNGSSVGIFREFPYHFQGPVPTSQPPPQPPVAGFNIYGHPLNSKAPASVYPFFEVPTGGPPPLQDAYHDALVLVSAPYHLAAAPFNSHAARLSDPAPFPGRDVPPLRIMAPSYYPHPHPHPHDLTRDTHEDERGHERRARRSYSPDRQQQQQQQQQRIQQETHDPTRGNTKAWPYSSPVNPHGCATPAPPPRISSHLAPPTSPASLGFHHHHHHHRSQSSSKNTTTVEPTTTESKKRQTSFRIDYDLRTHPATLRVSPSSSLILSKPACTPKEQGQSMTLICNLFPWIVEIHGPQHGYVTIYDILLQLHTFLHRPLELGEWTACSNSQQERIVRAWDRALGLGQTNGGWRERLARYFGLAKSLPTTSSGTITTGAGTRAGVGVGVGVSRIRLEPRDRSYEEGILRIDLLAAQFAATATTTTSAAAASAGPNTNTTSGGMNWVGLVRDDVLARRRGIVDPHDLERCWSLLVE